MKHEDPVQKLDAKKLKHQSLESTTEETIIITNESQLFADDYLIARRSSLFRRLNQPVKEQEPFLVPEKTWEGNAVVYGSVIDESDHIRLYYKCWDAPKTPFVEYRKEHGYGKYCICLARSEDGKSFSKDVLENAASPETNIVIDDCIDDFNIRKDTETEDESTRYKMLSSRGNWWAGLSLADSEDGITWNWRQDHAVPFFGDRCSYWYDPMRKRHVAWSRNYQVEDMRVIYHQDTPDFYDWSFQGVESNVQGAKYRGDLPRRVLAPDRYDHEQTEFYGAYGFWYRSMYFAYIEVYHKHWQRLDVQLACSRDGIHWERLCDREVFLKNGEHGQFDAYWIVPTFNAPVLRDGRLLIHYNGRPDPHLQPGFGHIAPGMGGVLALSTLREDGFVSLDATGKEGVLETKLLQLPENRKQLHVNVCPFKVQTGFDPMKGVVEVVSADNDVLQICEIESDVDPDQVWQSFELNQDLPEVIMLRFCLFNTRLYSFRIQ